MRKYKKHHYKYLISYYRMGEKLVEMGTRTMLTRWKIRDVKHINFIQKYIEKEQGYEGVVITNFREY